MHGSRFERESGKPSFRRFRAGLALGGPVIKDKTFYYAALDKNTTGGKSARTLIYP